MASTDDTRELQALRERIRAIDEELLHLVAERLRVARAIGECKLALGLGVKDFHVEKEVAQRNQKTAVGLGLAPSLVDELTRLLISHAVHIQDALHADEAISSSSAVGANPGGLRVLVVGGRGRMGAWLVDYFASFGHAVAIHDSADKEAEALERAAAKADVVVLSTPIDATAALIESLAAAKVKALVFDICSLKSPLVSAIAKARAEGLRITSLHPMFGPGARQLAGRNLIVCDCGDSEAAALAESYFAATAARITRMPLAEHDELMGVVLGLSHLLNLVFAEAVRRAGLPMERLMQVASTSFHAQLAVTKAVASENQSLYFEIQAENYATAAMVAHFQDALAAYAQAILSAQRHSFASLMEKGHRFLSGGAP